MRDHNGAIKSNFDTVHIKNIHYKNLNLFKMQTFISNTDKLYFYLKYIEMNLILGFFVQIKFIIIIFKILIQFKYFLKFKF